MTREQKQHLLTAIGWVLAWWIVTQQIAARIGTYCLEQAAEEWGKMRPPKGVTFEPPPFHVKPDGETERGFVPVDLTPLETLNGEGGADIPEGVMSDAD